jgi:hypothetical protein
MSRVKEAARRAGRDPYAVKSSLVNSRDILIAGLLLARGLAGQTLINPDKLPSSLRSFTAERGEQMLHCDIIPMQPVLDFGFRFQTGYTIQVPMQQYFGPGHAWVVMTRVTPENGGPAYLAARVRLPDVPLTTVVTDTFGGFMVGVGRYKVELALFDDESRVCRKQWKIEAKLKYGEHHVTPSVPPHVVADFAGGGLPAAQPRPDAPPFRMTVLLHAAPLSPRRLHLRANDRILLISTLSALLERAAASSVRLAVFNFDKQRVLYSSDDFTLKSMGDVYQALNRLELDTVDVQTLQNPRGHMDLLQSLIGRETSSAAPADAVVFLGPAARYLDKLPLSAIEPAPGGTRFYYFQYRPFDAGMRAMLPDSISSAVSSLKGRIIQIYTPGQFADAIRELGRGFKR